MVLIRAGLVKEGGIRGTLIDGPTLIAHCLVTFVHFQKPRFWLANQMQKLHYYFNGIAWIRCEVIQGIKKCGDCTNIT